MRRSKTAGSGDSSSSLLRLGLEDARVDSHEMVCEDSDDCAEAHGVREGVQRLVTDHIYPKLINALR